MECKTRLYRVPLLNTAQYKNYGTDSVATWKTGSHNYLRSLIFRSWIIGGYQPVSKDIELKDYPILHDHLREQYINYFFKYFLNTCCKKLMETVIQCNLKFDNIQLK